ncbi:MAG: PEP-CTERM sorting domain-containing protein [Planctomycetota bacterium]
MKNTLPCLAASALCAVLVGPAAHASFVLEDFDNFAPFGPGNYFGGWSAAVATSGPTGFTIDTTGFGGLFEAIETTPVPPGVDTLELDVTVTQGPVNIIFVTDATPAFGGQGRYFFANVPVGSHTLTADLALDNTLATSPLTELIQFFQIQAEFGTPYTVTFDEARLVVIPEPASLAGLALGGLLVARRRRA